MADDTNARRAPLGLSDHSTRGGPSGGETLAVALGALWIALSGGYFLFSGATGQDGLRFVLVLMTVFLPVAMIWVAATAMRATRIMREESARLQATVDALRHAYVAQSQGGRNDPQITTIARNVDELLKRQRQRASGTDEQPPQPGPSAEAKDGNAQGSLAFGPAAEETVPQLSNSDLIRALNFPRTAEDKEGFNALRRAFRDRPAAQLVQSAQDVLTLLSEEGVYMDDLSPDRARPEIWRRFAQGVRGREVAALGGIRDRSALERTAKRMREDPIFRDAAHHFLRLYDKAIARFDPVATDAEIADFADTRSSRAFMLLGRVAGAFDGPQGT
ncbi:hypothetical protein OCH239_17545 [Roseivivax halodurans JCM 10272]|uniref:Uncharacterized protein n=1 Tax=Roseivivax halodurans JCM 10272 TaxID=1449350 RepID=X7EIU5_9RHOB|nr:hypothetical protein [Roseivivax halodurans]ETX15091.1 hypothetical protein OCH239_17545 [Roseivivax halodurans JCM 10272]